MPHNNLASSPGLREYLRPLLQRWWLIAGVVIIVTGGTYVYSKRQPEVFMTTTSIFVDAGEGASLAGDGVQPVTDRTVQNQATLLTSREVTERVARKLRISPDAVTGVEASPTSGSDFVTITVRNGSAQRAADLANAFAEAFVELRASQQRQTLQDALDEQQKQLDDLPLSATGSADREELVATVRRLRLALSLPTGEAQQVDPARAPGRPVAPRPQRNAAFALALALIVGISLALGFERFDRRLRAVEDLEAAYRLPLFATVSHSGDPSPSHDGAAAMSDDLREAFRQMRTNLQLESLNRPIRRVLVTSAVPGEGKSTVARNLALAYSESGDRVAVVDCDLRRSTMHDLFGIPMPGGLTSVMIGEQTLADGVVKVPVQARGLRSLVQIRDGASGPDSDGGSVGTDVAFLSLLAAGASPANPQAVLSTDRLGGLLDELSAGHDVVIIDSPPILTVSDALIVAGNVDAVLLVARAGLTTSDDARRAVALLERVPDANPTGLIVNDVSKVSTAEYAYAHE